MYKIWTPEICINRQAKGQLCEKLFSVLRQDLRFKIKWVQKHRPEKILSMEKED